MNILIKQQSISFFCLSIFILLLLLFLRLVRASFRPFVQKFFFHKKTTSPLLSFAASSDAHIYLSPLPLFVVPLRIPSFRSPQSHHASDSAFQHLIDNNNNNNNNG